MILYLPKQDHVEEQKTRLAEIIDNVILERFAGVSTYQTSRSYSYQALFKKRDQECNRRNRRETAISVSQSR